jgi:hypothetical protein
MECSTPIQVRITKGIFQGMTGLLTRQTVKGVYVVWGDLCQRPLVCGPFTLDDVEVL